MATIPRHKALIWRIIQQAIPVRSALSKRGVQCLILCPRCLQKEETINHVFMDCHHTSKIWFGLKLGVNFGSYQWDFIGWLVHSLAHLNAEDMSYDAAVTCEIWQARNQQVFDFKDTEDSLVLERASESIGNYRKPRKVSESIERPTVQSNIRNQIEVKKVNFTKFHFNFLMQINKQ